MNLFSHKFLKKNCHLLCGSIVTTQVRQRLNEGMWNLLTCNFMARRTSTEHRKDNEISVWWFWLFPSYKTHLQSYLKCIKYKVIIINDDDYTTFELDTFMERTAISSGRRRRRSLKNEHKQSLKHERNEKGGSMHRYKSPKMHEWRPQKYCK